MPDDCGGHGTHVAGIVGASGAITGVAPDVTLGSYRVFGCSGATSSDVMLAAMERIYRDGADVLNMSISEDLSSWPEAPTAQAATRLAKKGIVVVAAAGNDRLDGLWAAGAPGVGKDVIAAAIGRQPQAADARVRALARRPPDRVRRRHRARSRCPRPGRSTSRGPASRDADDAATRLCRAASRARSR